jgi:flagellar hook-associated protein 2
MSAVGISFGSPTSGQGFNVSQTVSQIVANLQAVETPWQTQLTSLQSQDTALTGIGTDLSSLSSALESLTDLNGVLSEKEGSSSNTNVLELTSATSGAVAGSHSVTVTQLAQTSSYYIGDVAAGDTLSGSFTIAVGSGAAQAVDITAGENDTLSTLASYINSGSYGVTANVITDSSGEQLSLVSNTSGASGDITIDASGLTDATTGTGISFSLGQQGLDAELSVDGIAVTSASNTVSSAIPGVTFQLLSEAPDTPVQVEITNDNSDVETAVASFVSAYNTVVGDLNTQEGNDASGNAEPLFGNPTVALLQEQLDEAMNFVQGSGGVTSLMDLGVTASSSDDGTLTLDASTLDSMLNSNYEDVVNFFQASGSFTSFGANFSTVLNNLGNNAPDGAIYLQLEQDSAQESQLNANITNENETISADQTQLTNELNEANYTLEEIPSELQEINEMYSAITGYNENTNG